MTKYIEKFWRDATAADVARVMAGETVEARFRDHKEHKWGGSTLTGWHGHLSYKWVKATGTPFCYCQVYDPPQWFVDKPEPGEGYRLLEKFPDEALQAGDEVFQLGGWRPSTNHSYAQGQSQENWYRRRIEQPKPEPKHYSLQVGDTCYTPNGHRIKITEHGVEVT